MDSIRQTEISVILAHEDNMVREGIRRVLEARPGVRVVAEMEHGRDAVTAARNLAPDVALIDVHLPPLSGVDVVQQIRECGSTQCVVLAPSPAARQLTDSLRAGAKAFVPKSASGEELIAAIEAAHRGRRYLPQAAADEAVSVITGEPRFASATDITGRQRQVLHLIADGLSTKEIAGELGISIRTAQTHRAKLMSRLGVHKASGLVRYAIREGIVAA
ncbi:MAG: response regulator transcription factor [Myxococcales bacterium]|nr:response regulator transcription factor [Myxococcales bacterium]